MVQWLRLHTLTVEGVDQIPGWGTKIPQAPWHGQKKKRENNIPPIPFTSTAQVFHLSVLGAGDGERNLL